MKRLHDGQLEIDIELVKGLIKSQFPEYENLPIYEFDSTGTVNSIFKLGNDYCIRLPIVERYADSIVTEYRILPSWSVFDKKKQKYL
jgi:aminoglycoside phosphotransferase (APT) family kinase protein